MKVQVSEAYLKGMLTPLTILLNYREPWFKGHGLRVSKYSMALSKVLGLGTKETAILQLSSMLHDIGMLGIREEILHSVTALSSSDRAEIEKHPTIGATALEGVPGLAEIASVIRHHHERYDGTGYPAGLKGNSIPLLARIIAVVESFDAMTSDRPYRSAYPLKKAVHELYQGEQTGQFDPLIVDAFIKKILQREEDQFSMGLADIRSDVDINECIKNITRSIRELARQINLERLFWRDVTITASCKLLNHGQLSLISIDVCVSELGINYMVLFPKNRILAKKPFAATGTEAVFNIQLPSIGYFQSATVEMLGKLVYSEATRTYRAFFYDKQPNESIITQFLYAKQLEEKKISHVHEVLPNESNSCAI